MFGDDAALNFGGAAVNCGGATVDVFRHGGHAFGRCGRIAGVVWRKHLTLPGHGALACGFYQEFGAALAQFRARDLHQRR